MRRKLILTLLAALSIYALPGGLRAQSDQIIYGESLEAGWQDWSWCARDLNSTDYAHAGSRSVKVTYTAGWQGFYLRHSQLDTSVYTALAFWIHGGAANGRNINVAALINDSAQAAVPLNSYVEGGAVAAGQWRKVTIPLAALNAANTQNLTGFWLQENAGGAQPAFYLDDISFVAAPAPSQVIISVDANNIKRTIDSRMFGVAGAVWDAQFDTPATVTLLGANDTKILRFPGGSLSNSYHWATNTTDNNTWQWATSFDEFANVALAVGAQAFITVNYGTGTPQEAAEWVRYSNITKGYGFKYWEVGNENYGSWERDARMRPHDPLTYATAARDYINAMKAVDPTIKVGVVAVTGEDSYANYPDNRVTNPRTGQQHSGWTPVMLATLGQLNVTPDFIIYHKYDQSPGQESDATLLASARSWADDAADLRQQLDDYLGPQAAAVELVCTENNSVSSQPGKQTTSLVNGLFYADSFGQVIQTEFKAWVWWIFRNAQETNHNNSTSLYGWRQYGDYGMVSEQNDPYPTYYVSKLINNFAAGGDSVIHATSDYNLLAVYAVKQVGGGLSLLVINKSPTTNLNAAINLAGFTPQSTLAVYSYSVAQDEAARTGAGSPDVAFSSFAGAATAFSYTFPAYSATVLALSPASACSPQVAPAGQFFDAAGGQGIVSVTSSAGCAWNAVSNTDWITINSGASGSGSAPVAYTVANNSTGVARQGMLTVAGRAFTVLQDGGASSDCAYTIAPVSKTFKPAGGGASVSVTAGPRCAWQAASNVGWITITSGSMGIGDGSVSYEVAPNSSSSARKGTVTIAGKTFAVKQKGG